ncbi:hypothetical protein PQX77_020349 [Marasmius sp. AFHP31]|nr:hypothetical protein PQX77_020349 [Marasmius sp. AFHP31]
MSLHNIFEHFRNALFQFYNVNPYQDNSTFKVGNRRLILSLPFDQWDEALFSLLFQHFFLSHHRSLYWGYLVRYDHHQDKVYFCKVHFHTSLPLAARKFVNTVTKGIARVGFLSMKTALIPGAVQAWIDAVILAAEAPAPPTLGYEELQFFAFTPQMGRWLSCTPLAYCPLVCNLYYLARLQQNKAWHYIDLEVDVPSVAPIYFYKDNLSEYIPLESQNIINMVAESIARIGFLGSHMAFIPGATHAWIDSVVHCMVDPPLSKLEPKQLTFFQYDPLMAHWVTRPSYHHNPVLHEEFYLNELNRPNSPSVWDYQHDNSELDEYFGLDEVAVHNMWE